MTENKRASVDYFEISLLAHVFQWDPFSVCKKRMQNHMCVLAMYRNRDSLVIKGRTWPTYYLISLALPKRRLIWPPIQWWTYKTAAVHSHSFSINLQYLRTLTSLCHSCMESHGVSVADVTDCWGEVIRLLGIKICVWYAMLYIRAQKPLSHSRKGL